MGGSELVSRGMVVVMLGGLVHIVPLERAVAVDVVAAAGNLDVEGLWGVFPGIVCRSHGRRGSL